MFYAEKDFPTNVASRGMWDEQSGFALDIPLGLQQTPAWWEQHGDIRDRILMLRQAAQIEVADDQLADNNDDDNLGPELPPEPLPGSRTIKAPREMEDEEKGTPGVFPAQLKKYWLGNGLSRWATTPTPYRSLVAALRKEGVSGRFVHGLAAKLYHWHFGTWPGKHNGGKKSLTELEARAVYIAEVKGIEL